MEAGAVPIGSHPLTWQDYERVVYGRAAVRLETAERVAQHRAELERQLAAGAVIYAVNTGYGADSGRVIPLEAAGRVQLNTLRSHAIRLGRPVPEPIGRGMLLIKAQAGAQGLPGITLELVERLVTMLNAGLTPVVYEAGSQSASGDLIQNGQLGLAVAGEGEVWAGGQRRQAAECGMPPFRPGAKEGVSLTNDLSFSTALAFDVVRAAERLAGRADEIAALSLQALLGFPAAYDARLVAARPHPGAIEVAGHMRGLLAESALIGGAQRRQDPYSLRCVPQVHGAVRQAVAGARAAVTVEIASVADNPLVFAGDQEILSGGNFHGAALALPLDGVCAALAMLAAFSQRRTQLLVSPGLATGLPDRLAAEPAEQLGLLLANTAAAALASECAALAAPASVTGIGVDVMEDHVPMAAFAARKAADVALRTRRVLALELLCAAQAADLRGPDGLSPASAALHRAVRQRVPFLATDLAVDGDLLLDLV